MYIYEYDDCEAYQINYKMTNSEDSKYIISSFPNGLRVVVRQTNSLVSYIGVAVNAGSRDERSGQFGLAHFVEHTIFKGTGSRKSWHISNRLESVGGELNAYTSKEETVIYTNSPAGDPERAIELLADIIADSRFPDKEIEMEREVVIEEINSYLDAPSERVYDEFEERIYEGSALAHNILGTPETVKSLQPHQCRNFLDEFYTPENMVVYVADPTDPARIIRLLEKHFGPLHFPKSKSRRTAPPQCAGFNDVIDNNRHQAHTVIGYRLFDRSDSRRFPLFLLNNYLGGPCMNSRLNQELREKRGLVYTVDSSVALLSDTGLMQIYFGCDPENSEKCIKLILREIEKLASSTLSQRSFDSILNQYCGQLLVSSDNNENMAMSMAKSLIYFGKVHDMKNITDRLRMIKPEDLRDVARLLMDSPICRLTLR